MEMGFNNLSDMCWILKLQVHDVEIYYFYPLSMWRKTQSVTRKHLKEKKKKGLKGGEDTEEKGGSFYIYVDILSLSLQYIRFV